jgi:transcriptional regulator with XRE-family HTH domain
MEKRYDRKIITREVKIIRALREKKKLSVQKASEVIGTNKSTLTALENGRIDLSEDWIRKTLRGYEVNEISFKQMVEAKDTIREEIVSEVMQMLLKLSYDRLIAIRQVLVSFSSS